MLDGRQTCTQGSGARYMACGSLYGRVWGNVVLLCMTYIQKSFA